MLASTQNSPGALAESSIGRRTLQETARLSDKVRTHQTIVALAAQDRSRRGRPGTTPSRGPQLVQRGASTAPLPRQGPAARTMSPVLGQPSRALRSRQVNPWAKAAWLEEGTTATGKPTGAPRATGPVEARRTRQGQKARQRGTPPATTKAHGQVLSNNVHRVPQTKETRTTRNEPRHGRRCQATHNPHTKNPNQLWR